MWPPTISISMPRETTWHFEWQRTWPDVWAQSSEARWDAVFASAVERDVFQHPELARAWAETCGAAAGAEPLVGFATGPGGASVVLPWAIQRQRGRLVTRRRLGYIGDDLFGYHDPLASTSTVNWDTFWREARDGVAGACDHALFRSVHRRQSSRDASRGGDEYSVLKLDRHETFDALLNACSANHRGDIRRRRRRLAERGTVSLWIAGRDEAAAALADWQQHGAQAYRDLWTRRARRNTAWRDALDAFLARVLTHGVARGWTHYAALRVNGESIAWHIGLADRQRLFWWIPAHRPDWESFAPGKVLLAAIIEELCAGGWRELHFLAGAHAYKLAWQPEAGELTALRWYAPGVRGRLLSWYDDRAQSA